MQSKFERLLTKNSYFLTRGHDFVEIGGIKWATCNVGAEKSTDSGLYFSWGDTKGYTTDEVRQGVHRFVLEEYKFHDCGSLLKYNHSDGKTVLDLEDDPVHANWGGKWRMPTTEEFIALDYAVNSTWTSNYQGSGVAGLVLTDKTDSSKVLFFPAAGLCNNGHIYCVGSRGYYWPSSASGTNLPYANVLLFLNGAVNWQYDSHRSLGFTVRGVVCGN